MPGTAAPASATLAAALQRHALIRPRAPAVVAPGRLPLSYFELVRTVEEIGAGLRGGGAGRKTRIGIVLPSGPEAAVANIVVACHAIAVPLNPDLVETEFEERSAILRLDAVAVLDSTRTAAEAVAERRGLRVFKLAAQGRSAGRLALVGSPDDSAVEAVGAGPDDIAFILNTSGTTARPKLVPVTHRNLAAMAEKMQRWFGLSPDDRSLCVMPLHYAQGLKQSVFVPVIHGASIACSYGPPLRAEFFDRLSGLAPTWYTAGPTHQRWILDVARSQPGGRHSLRFIQSAAAYLPESVRFGLEEAFGVPVLEAYGLSEAGLVAANPIPPAIRKPGTVGLASPDEVAVVGDDGERLGYGGMGEILVRGPSVTPGYLDNPEANRQAFFEGGWFRTGDLGAIDEDGFLTVLGRVKELINRGGEKISPAEIDQALLHHPAVAEAAAFGVPHQRLGEDVAAAVVLRAGSSASPTELRQFLRGRLAPSKTPHRILIVDELPKGDTGKIQRAQLREALPSTFAAPPSSAEQKNAQSSLEFDLAELWRKLLGCDTVGFEDDFFEKGGDSLLAMEMLLELERMTGRSLPETILFDAPTVRQLAWSVAGGAWAEAKPLIPVQTSGHAAPLFFFHGDYDGGGYYTRRLAHLLGPEQPFVAVAPNRPGIYSLLPSIEKMAAERLSSLMAEWPHGPFRLGGFSGGALVAFETARLLSQTGREVELVAMIDPPTFSTHPVARAIYYWLSGALFLCTRGAPQLEDRLAAALSVVRSYGDAMERPSGMSPARRRAWARGKLERVVFGAYRALMRRDALGSRSSRTESSHQSSNSTLGEVSRNNRRNSALMRRLKRVVKTYVPKPAPVSVICFSAVNDGEPWRRLSRDFEIIPIDCDHLGCITTHLAMVARHLRLRLENRKGN
jgi:oxalate---CoA ligase